MWYAFRVTYFKGSAHVSHVPQTIETNDILTFLTEAQNYKSTTPIAFNTGVPGNRKKKKKQYHFSVFVS